MEYSLVSLRYEQRRALLRTRELLWDMLDPNRRPKTVKELRMRVFCAMRHFPLLDERGEPLWSQDDFDNQMAGVSSGEINRVALCGEIPPPPPF